MTEHAYRIYYESRELARELGDPLLGTLRAATAEEAVRLAQRDPEIARRAMPCVSLWAVRVKDETRGRDERVP
jgi:1,2-phenylacetyl-CoA epoxidase PaaB subunit